MSDCPTSAKSFGAWGALEGPRVLTAPPGSGKSTRVPLWCRDDGPVLVVQPRRVAARSLASHLASTSGGPLGREVGYAVRGAAADDGARVLFVTPGVALRMLAGSRRFRTVILDEFHERTLDLDLLLALVHARDDLALVVLSATLDGDRVAEHLGGTHVRAEGRLYPVDVRYAGPGRDLPDAHGLGVRVRAALAELDGAPGDRLVFVPGRAEIGEVVGALQGSGDEVIELHGGLALRDQDRVFRPGDRRRVIVATNVAETSLTLPGIGVVVDTGLVRRTHYHDGRGWLLLGPIAQDAADQRAGRAGRLGPGIAVRLWGERAPLRERTPPEVHRESLVPLVLAAAAAGHPALALPFVDPPPDHAVQTAREQLRALGALGPDGSITDRGRRLFQLPLDAHLAHLLVVAEAEGGLAEAIDLVAALATSRPLFRPDRPEDDELREGGCDATALLRAVRIGEAGRHRLHGEALADVRREASRLREAFGEPDRRTVDRMDLARLLVAAWPRCAHVVRRRKREVRWSNGGTEVALDRSSAVSEEVDGLLALDFRASGRDRLHRELRVTAALPLSREELASLGVGEERLGEVTVERGALLTVVERVYAGTVLARTTREPTGPMAREALADRLLAGQIWRGFHMAYAERHRLSSLDAALEGRETPGEPRATLLARLESVGLEAPGDLALLEREDLLPPEVPDDRRTRLEREFPREVVVGTDRFRVEVLAGARIVELHVLGARLKKPPPASWLPGFRGFSVRLVDRGVRRWLRQG